MALILRLDQRSQAWHDWRNGKDLPDGTPRIMASDIPVIIGVSPFKSVHQLWLEKTGQRAPDGYTYAMEHGVRHEDVARLQYQQEYGTHVVPICVQHERFPEFGASLDGLSILGDILTEVKCPISEKTHHYAVMGTVPSYYWPQVQWQLFVSGADAGHYYSWFHGDGKRVVVLPDPAEFEVLVTAAHEFRRCLIDRVPPAGEAFVAAALAWRRAKRQLEEVEEAIAAAKLNLAAQEAFLVSMLGAKDRLEGGGVSVARFEKRGTVDYAALLDDLGVPAEKIESYRKKGSTQFRVTETDKSPVPDEVTGVSPSTIPESDFSF